MVNEGVNDVLLYSWTSHGVLDSAFVVSLPAGVVEVEANVASVSFHLAATPVQDRVDTLDLSALTE